MSNASHHTPASPTALRPTRTPDSTHPRPRPTKAHQGYLDALHKASCDMCGQSLGLLHTGGKMWDIRDPHFFYDLKLLCLPCTEAMEGRIAKGVQEPPDIFDGI